jgi:putative tryptophan/tyrosine transport system substrate-binding protein
VTARRRALAWAGAALLPLTMAPWAQPAPRRIVFLTGFTRADGEPLLDMVRDELRKLGWGDGREIVLSMRSSEGRNDQLPAMAAEISALGTDLLLVQSIPAARALMAATKTIPIVMISVGNPVENGLVPDYRKPGGNVTGSAYPADEAMRKLLQLLKEALPRVRSAAVFANPSNPGAASMSRLLRADAQALGLQMQVVEVAAKSDFDAAFAAIRSAGAQAILLPPEALILSQREAIAEFAQAQRVPVLAVGTARGVPATTLIGFGPMRAEFAIIAARQVDRILKGAKPAEMPIEQPTRFELRINLRTARALGLTLPQSLLLQATEVIE